MTWKYRRFWHGKRAAMKGAIYELRLIVTHIIAG